MARGTGPPPPLGDHPNGIDVSHPNYAIDSVNWHEPPKQFSENYMNTASMTLRTTNDSAYKIVGNATTWNRYVLFGYHAYDHCFQFDTQWERMSQNQTDTLKFIWEGYSYLLSRGMHIPTKMERWAIDIARPYLQHHLLSALTVDTTDPRSARRVYDEDELMRGDDSVDSTIPASEWTPVLGKPRNRVQPDALETPLPVSPTNTTQDFSTPSTQTGAYPKAQSKPTQETTLAPKKALSYVSVNDGTLRVTVRWKPDTYSILSEDDEQWNYAATDTIHYILETVSDAVLFPWKNGSTTTHIPSLELTPDNLRHYIAPKITKIDSIKMYVFSFRLCISTGAGKWIGDKQTQKNLEQQNVEVNISNSSCDSGETISIAGYIFFKHPKYTQRKYYLSHLRRQLQATTPYFDIGYHRKTPTGQDIPHLSIKCGENHVGPLTEILSAYLDGTNTAVFLGRLLLSKMSTAEVDALFQTHADYMTNSRTISMAPTIQNVDLIRTEYNDATNQERNTREWATSLKDTAGNSLRCDADNGGDSRRAQLIVPVEHMAQVQHLFKAYKESISTFNQREAAFTNLIQDASPPQAIYVPTVAVHNNLALIQKRSAFSVWENAPASVRSPTGTPLSGYRPPISSTKSLAATNIPSSHNVITQPSQPTQQSAQEKRPTKKTTQPAMDSIQELDMTDETATTHSQMTISMTTHNKFAEIEASIRRHQQAVTQHQADLAQVNERALTTLTLVEKTAADVQQLTEHTTEQLTALRNEIRQEAMLQAQAQQAGFARMMTLIQQLTPAPLTQTTAVASWQAETTDYDSPHNSEAENADDASDTMSTQTTDTESNKSSIAASPVKKKSKRKSRDPGLSTISQNLNPLTPSNQDKGAQQSHPSTPEDGAL